MKKIPTLFVRDWQGDKSLVLDVVNPVCEWVIRGEGIPTRKLDGCCCMIKGGKLFKRREVKPGQIAPSNFEEVDFDEETRKRVGWVPVDDSADDKWFRKAWDNSPAFHEMDRTYEAVGPHFQGNPEGYEKDCLVPHDDALVILDPIKRTFSGIKSYLSVIGVEGIVFHHPDGRMAKIKARDFGIRRGE